MSQSTSQLASQAQHIQSLFASLEHHNVPTHLFFDNGYSLKCATGAEVTVRKDGLSMKATLRYDIYQNGTCVIPNAQLKDGKVSPNYVMDKIADICRSEQFVYLEIPVEILYEFEGVKNATVFHDTAENTYFVKLPLTELKAQWVQYGSPLAELMMSFNHLSSRPL